MTEQMMYLNLLTDVSQVRSPSPHGFSTSCCCSGSKEKIWTTVAPQRGSSA